MKKPKFPLEVKAGAVRVKIYNASTPERERYTLAYYDGPERKLRQFADFAEAHREAKETADTLNAGRGSALELSGADRDSYLSAMRQLKPLDVPLHVAVSEYVKARGFNVPIVEAAKSYAESHNAKLPDKAVAEVVAELIDAKRRDGAGRTYLAPLKSCLDRFSRDCRDNIANMQTADIDVWLRGLKLSPRSRNNHRNAVVLLFNFAKSAGYLNRDRTAAAEHTALARKKVEAIEVFTPEEFSKLLAAANVTDKAIMPFFVLGGLCGLRTVEASRLLWEDIRWPETSIVISAAIAKTRTRRLAPLTDTAAAWLAGYKAKTGKVLAVDKLHKRVADVCKVAGVTWKDNGLRHSFITYRLATIKDAMRTAFEAGNSPQVIRSNYDAVASEKEGKAWFAVMPKTAANVIEMTKAAA